MQTRKVLSGIGLVAASLMSGQAFALHWMNCESSDASLVRIEREIWGANPVNWTLNGTDLGSVTEKFLGRRIISRTTVEEWGTPTLLERFSAYVILTHDETGDVVGSGIVTCAEYSNDALD